MKLSNYNIAIKDFRSLDVCSREKASLLLYELDPCKVYSVRVVYASVEVASRFVRDYPASRFVALDGKFPSRDSIKKLISKLY